MSVDVSLALYERVAMDATKHIMDLTRHISSSWQRTTRDVGGYWDGDFIITSETMLPVDMINFFTTSMGRRVVELTTAIVSWEGEITQMDLTLDGVVYRRTMQTERWHNKVKVTYTDAATSVSTSTAWGETTSSSNEYGESSYIDLVDKNYDAAAATALRDRRLVQNSYPKPVPVSGLSSGIAYTGMSDSLHVFCTGYVHTINRRFQEADIGTASIDTHLAALVGNSEFVTAGTINPNAMTTDIVCSDISMKLWDVMEELILMGDASGNRWVGGVRAGREFHYEQAETAITHYWRNGRLMYSNGEAVVPSLIEPNIIVQVSDVIFGTAPAGDVWNDPRNVYIEEVEFIAPNRYRLIPYGGSSFDDSFAMVV